MKATDLMIGDWVLFNGNSKKVTSLLVTDLGVDQIYVFGKSCQVATISEYIEPIPLTEEILEQNGFVRHDKHKYSVTGSNYKYLKVRCYADTYFEIGNAVDEEGELQAFADIQYVHELQHALKLCGIEKEIDLEKL